MKHFDSETITSLGELVLGTGTPDGGLGLAMPDASAAPWLARHLPSEVDQAILSRASQHGVALQVKYEGRYPRDAPSYVIAVGCEAHGSEVARALMIADLVNFHAPAETRTIEAWLAELSVLVARRPQEQIDEAIRLEAYASRLRQYPADVARYAALGRTWKFWPTWEELERECRMHASPRQQMLAALQRPLDPPRPAVTPEARERIKAQINDLAMSMQAQAKAAAPRKRHWSETAASDDPRWEHLHRARAANPLMQQVHQAAAE